VREGFVSADPIDSFGKPARDARRSLGSGHVPMIGTDPCGAADALD
jgi:hypothetical protein